MNDTRLIERWLPIAALGEESVRERRSMTALPPTYYLHVWWARRPLVAVRAAVLASVLPADADHKKFMHALGILGDPVAARRKIDVARRTGVRVENPYDYDRAFSYTPDATDRAWLAQTINGQRPVVLDPTAGGGSIPFEAVRLGFDTLANDLNPVAALIMRATVEWPLKFDMSLKHEFDRLAKSFRSRLDKELAKFFPQTDAPERLDLTYLWARTIHCPYCEGLVPLSPNWRLAPDGTGVRLLPHLGGGPGTPERHCSFDVVFSVKDQSSGTAADGDGNCPYPDCGRVINGDVIKGQAQAGAMGEQLYAVVIRRQIETRTKAGKRGKDKWERSYRAPRSKDDNSAEIAIHLAERMEKWETLDLVPSERVPTNINDTRPIQYGMPLWRDLFSPRQLLGHGIGVEVFRELLAEREVAGSLSEVEQAAFVYLALSLDKMLNYNSRMSVWMPSREVIANTFNRHDFAFCWSHAEMAPLVDGAGYDWAIEQTAKCINELVKLVNPDSAHKNGLLDFQGNKYSSTVMNITCKSGDMLDHIKNHSWM